ncbi:MAG: glycoside hydrolase family 88 protein [Chloroflexi bacterium]|nr:glycoside hydrolase family 88 protein [Chloroflexota bacterium]
MTAVFDDALKQSIKSIRHNLDALEEFPESFKNGAWQPIEKERAAGHWVDGFWTGLLWLAYAHTNDSLLRMGAEHWTNRLAHMKTSTGTHDLGFIFYLSHVIAGRLTGDCAWYENAIEAARTLTARFNPRGEYLQAWDDDGIRKWAGRTNIDLMMNLALLYWATDLTGDAALADIATQHARTSRLALVRGDGSTAHVADFDPDSGLLIRREQYQGYSHDSCWSRGQAWALYGFATCYRHTGIPAFLTTAQALAEFTARHLPDDLVPYWDYNSPHIPSTYRDSSAAAVTVCGLLELAAVDNEGASRWASLAQRILTSLCENYLIRDASGPSSILRDGARSVPANLMEHGLIYGDYYFLEALTAFTRPDIYQRALAVDSVLSGASE